MEDAYTHLQAAEGLLEQIPESAGQTKGGVSDRLALFLAAGDIEIAAAKPKEAVKNFQKALDIATNIGLSPGSSEPSRTKSVCLKKLISAQFAIAVAERNEPLARSVADMADSLLNHDRELVRKNPMNRRFLRELSVSLRLNAQIQLFLRDSTKANTLARESVEITDSLLRVLPDRVELYMDTGLAAQVLSEIQLQQNEEALALETLTLALRALGSYPGVADSKRMNDLKSEMKMQIEKLSLKAATRPANPRVVEPH